MTTTNSSSKRRQSVRQIAARRQQRKKWQRWIGTGILVAIVVIGSGWWWMSARTDNATDAELAYEDLPVAGMVLGNPDAAHTLVEYGDYRCVHCAEFMESSQADFLRDFVLTGEIKFEFRPMPVLGGDITDPANPSVRAAEASLCAFDQDKYWEFHDRAFEPVLDGNPDGLDHDYLVSIASDIDLDSAAFATCLDTGTHRQQVIDYYNEGMLLGMSGVPGFFLDGTMVLFPATGYEGFKQNIERQISG